MEEVKKFHFDNHLKALEDNRNFLLLNKISINTLIVILLEFYELENEKSFPIINGILENYFNRNNIKAIHFFEEEDTEILQSIWEQFHHSLPN